MGKYFGTDGIRGKANSGAMTPSFVTKIGQAFALTLKNQYPKPRVILGKDTRISGYMIEGALIAGLNSMGVDVLVVGPLPTPGIAYLTRGMRAEGGIVISASHNTYSDNGIKLFDNNGFKLPSTIEEQIENFIDDPDLEKHLVHSAKMGRAKRIDDALGQYSVFLKEGFPKSLNLVGKRIILDCANGAGYRVAPKVFSELGAEVISIHDEPNGLNINENCGALHPEILQEKVKLYKADIGIALDGDADRIVLCDEKGEILDGDQIIALCALMFKSKGLLISNTICVTVMSNKGLDVCMQEAGIKVIRSQVGDKYVMEEMRKQNLILGGEQSGHILFLNSSTTGDAIIAALKVLEIMCDKNQPLSLISQIMQKFPQYTHNVSVTHKPKIESLVKTTQALKVFEEELGQKGRILLRYSGTESLARITLEGPFLDRLVKIAQEIEEIFTCELKETQ
ncbi:MAG: phosphoglucosamine mutase [Silvanigrellaceae bacterium]|nr:phosphoglucosamine mutase [Silvanigrellaceae bacterium]